MSSDNILDKVKKLREILLGEGFFLLVEHGIENSIIDKAYEQSEIFHNLDDNDPRKQATHYRHSRFGRGWSPCGEEPAYSAGTKATCSAFDMCYEIPEVDTEHENYGPNLWPLEMPEYQEAVYGYYLKFSELEQKVAIAIEQALGLDKNYITSKMTERSPSTMRLIFYPPVKEKPEAGIQALHDALEAAVKRQLMSDVPYGVLLSGGLDSSITSALAKKFARKRIESEDENEDNEKKINFNFCIV